MKLSSKIQKSKTTSFLLFDILLIEETCILLYLCLYSKKSMIKLAKKKCYKSGIDDMKLKVLELRPENKSARKLK